MNDKVDLNKAADALIEQYRRSVPQTCGSSALTAPAPSIIENRFAISVAEAGIRLGLSQKSVERLIKRGEIRAKRAGRRVLVPISEIEAWLNRKD